MLKVTSNTNRVLQDQGCGRFCSEKETARKESLISSSILDTNIKSQTREKKEQTLDLTALSTHRNRDKYSNSNFPHSIPISLFHAPPHSTHIDASAFMHHHNAPFFKIFNDPLAPTISNPRI